MRQDKFKIYPATALLLSAMWLLHGFILAMLWAVVIVIATWPIRTLAIQKTQLADLGVATLMTALVVGLLFLPIAYVLIHATSEASILAHWIITVLKNGVAVPSWLTSIPLIGHSAVVWWSQNLSDPATLSALIDQADNASIIEYAQIFGAQVAHRLITLVLTILIIFFLYRDGEILSVKSLTLLNKFTGKQGVHYGLQAAIAIRATVSGLVLVGLAEGFLIGVAYTLSDVPHPVVLGMVTGVFAMIPFAAPIIFCIVAGMLFTQGSAVAAIAVFMFSMSVLFIGDHFVRPKIIGKAVKLPFLWVFFGILGGVEVFGLIGLFVGPALMALVMTMWRDLTDESPTIPRSGSAAQS
jgi:predicted PurR-regulated permease PerM